MRDQNTNSGSKNIKNEKYLSSLFWSLTVWGLKTIENLAFDI